MGRSGLLLSDIRLGTMTYGGKRRCKPIGRLSRSEVPGQIRTAFDSGVDFIISANVYSEGDSESPLGQALNQIGANKRTRTHKGLKDKRRRLSQKQFPVKQ